MTFMLSKAQLGSISFLREGSDLSNSVWDGTQIDWLINSRSSMRVFVGKRQAGQRCIGGVCRAFPEFDGIEFGLVYSL